jgi:hypothetical protein
MSTGSGNLSVPDDDGTAYGKAVREAVRSALQAPLGPGESPPFTVRVFSAVSSAEWISRQQSLPAGSVLYVPPAGLAFVQLSSHLARSPGSDAARDEAAALHPGPRRIADALAAHGPIDGSVPRAGAAARLAALVKPSAQAGRRRPDGTGRSTRHRRRWPGAGRGKNGRHNG